MQLNSRSLLNMIDLDGSPSNRNGYGPPTCRRIPTWLINSCLHPYSLAFVQLPMSNVVFWASRGADGPVRCKPGKFC